MAPRRPRRRPLVWLDNIDSGLRLLLLGIDVRRYIYLDARCPTVDYLAEKLHISAAPGAPAPSEEVFTRCRRFVVDTALDLEAEDYGFDTWEAQRAELKEHRRRLDSSR